MPTYTVAAVCVPDAQWVRLFETLIQFRRQLRQDFGLYMRAEVKGSELAKGSGPWAGLGLSDRKRKYIYRSFMRLQGASRAIKTYAVVVDKSRCPDEEAVRRTAWRYALQRVERLANHHSTTAMLFPDSGQYIWLRRLSREMRRHAVVGSMYGFGSLNRPLQKVLVDDPVERDSKQSYMIQLADLNAYAAFRNRVVIPQFPQHMWRELDGAILRAANKNKPHQEPGIVLGP
jgi:hypothetical protein